jgi:hypothetical protein
MTMADAKPPHEGDLDDPMHKYLCRRCVLEQREIEEKWERMKPMRRPFTHSPTRGDKSDG